MKNKALPIGVENFEHMITESYYYVDKTPFIKELLDKKAMVNLFTRPRRFGKTLNISMLHYFFDVLKSDKRHLFKHLKISKAEATYLQHQNAYPVIHMTLKGVEGKNFEQAFSAFKRIIQAEFRRHDYLLESDHLNDSDKESYLNAREVNSDSLQTLSYLLTRHYQTKTVILIDEYDVPLENSYFNGFYEEMLNFIRPFYHSALKTNDSLAFSVMTGCLRISRESIFTGLNNLHILGINSHAYAEYFGFTESEVSRMLAEYDLSFHLPEVKDWYNGYLFGSDTVYNPWSVVKYVFDSKEAKAKNARHLPRTYWSNTSSNHIVHDLIETADEATKYELEILMSGGVLEKPIKEDIIYSEITESQDNLWNFLYFTGYLKKVSERLEGNTVYYQLKIPNREVAKIYDDKISEWFQKKIQKLELSPFYSSLLKKDAEKMTQQLTDLLMDTISYLDSAENFYHGFLAGLLSFLRGYYVKSNREAGTGRSDLVLEPKSKRQTAFVIKIKVAKNFEALETSAQAAINQIQNKNYTRELKERGFSHIVKIGIAFCGKDCEVKIND